MLITTLVMALAINGGMYVGTIAYSAYTSAKHDKTISLFEDHHSLPSA